MPMLHQDSQKTSVEYYKRQPSKPGPDRRQIGKGPEPISVEPRRHRSKFPSLNLSCEATQRQTLFGKDRHVAAVPAQEGATRPVDPASGHDPEDFATLNS